MKRRVICILLCLCMALMLFPTTAMADDTEELQYMLGNSEIDKIVLERDYTISSTLTVDRYVTLDLNGHVIKMTASDRVIKIAAGELTLQDSAPNATHTGDLASLPAGGVITNSKSGGGVYIYCANLIMNGGTIYKCYSPGSACGAGVEIDGGKFTMNGGVIEECIANIGSGVYVGGSFTMNGGVITGCYGGGSGVVYVRGSFTMNGGTIEECRGESGGALGLAKNSKMFANGGDVKSQVRSYGIIQNTATDGSCTRFYDAIRNCVDSLGEGGVISAGVYYGGIVDEGGKVEDTYHTVSFNLNGADGSAPTQWFVNTDTAPALKPADPTKEGDTFIGWFTDEALTTPYDFTRPVTENITLYAGFKPVTYTVTYDGGDSEGSIAAGTKTHGVNYTLSSDTFTREGYVQYGWEDEEGNFYKLGGVYSTDADVTLYPVWDEILTLTANFTTTVSLGDNAEPDVKTFELEVIDSRGGELIFDDVTVTASVDTDGAGDYTGELTVVGPYKQLDKMLGEFAFVRQIDDGEEGWTVDDTVWAVRLYKQEIAARSMGGVFYSLLILPTKFEDNGDALVYSPDMNASPVEEMSFTNIYTKHAHEHEYELKHDENGHWNECGCGDIQNEEAHKYGDWKVTKEATTSEEGEREHICTVCGYTEAEVIAKLAEPDEPDEPTDAQTGDNGNIMLWLALLIVSGGIAVIAFILIRRKRRAQ